MGFSSAKIKDWLIGLLLLAACLYFLALYAEGQWWQTTRFLRELISAS